MTRKDDRVIAALCSNALIVVLELIALALSLTQQGVESFLFYTQDSNYFAMAASLLFCIYAAKNLRSGSEIPQWVHTFRYIAVSCLMVTFFVVILVLMPMMDENPFYMLYGGSMLYQHTLCPVLAAVSFFAFERKKRFLKTDALKALLPTLIYALAAIILNICRIIEGPYPFLMVYAQPWYMSILWCAVILGIAGLLGFAVLWLYNCTVKNL